MTLTHTYTNDIAQTPSSLTLKPVGGGEHSVIHRRQKHKPHKRNTQHQTQVETAPNCCQLHTNAKWGTREMQAPERLDIGNHGWDPEEKLSDLQMAICF